MPHPDLIASEAFEKGDYNRVIDLIEFQGASPFLIWSRAVRENQQEVIQRMLDRKLVPSQD